MKKVIVGFVFFFIGVADSIAVNKWQQNFLHRALYNNSASVTTRNVNITDSIISNNVYVNIPQVRAWIVEYSYCNPNPITNANMVSAKGNYRYWLRLPSVSKWIEDHSGLKYKIESVSWSIADTYNNNNEVFVGPNYYQEQYPNTCWSLGYKWGLSDSELLPISRDFSLTINIDRATAFPGLYKLSIPFAWAYEENKGSYNTNESFGFKKFGNIMKGFMDNYIDIPVEVSSKCDIRDESITLSHGSMTPSTSINNITEPYNYKLTCNYDASVSISLIGISPVPGKSENYTKCGVGGSCELKYNGNSHPNTFKVKGGTSKVFAITSTYNPNDILNPVEGSFQGSAILRILVN